MNYTFHQLRILIKVAELQSVTKASEELYLTQPAISIQLKKLQEQFDLPLVEIVGRKLYITDFGREIVARSKRILAEGDEIKYLVDQYKGLISGRIRISVVSTGKYVMPYFLKPFMDNYPGVEISLDVSNKNKVIEGMIKNDSDFSLVSVLPKGLNVHSLELMDNELYLVSSASHPFQPKKPQDLEKTTLLFREEGSATRNAMESFLKTHQIKVKKSMELVSNEAVKQAVNAGIGFSILPIIGIRNLLTLGGIKIHTMKDLPVRTKWNLIYNQGKELTPAQLTLLQFIQDNRARIVEQHFTDVG
ncbi:MAG: LysR family transcriptional regulator [Bacteroidota bacterium]